MSIVTSLSNFDSIFNSALHAYKERTKLDLATHPLLSSLQTCDSPEAVLTILRDQIFAFDQSQGGDERLTNWLVPTVNVLYAFSATLGEGVGLVNIKSSHAENVCSDTCFSGILTGESTICWDWCSPLGPYIPWPTRVNYRVTGEFQAAKDASAFRDTLLDLFSRIEHFFARLNIYTTVPPISAMTGVIVEIVVEVLSFLAIATKITKRGRTRKLLLYVTL